MPFYRATWFIEALQPALRYASSEVGWTESWYITATSLEDAIGRAVNGPGGGALSYAQLRRQTLANGYRIAWVRVSAEPDQATGVLIPQSKVAALDNVVGFAGEAAQVNCAILVDFYVLPIVPQDRSHRRAVLFRGLPISVINRNVIDTGSAIWPNFQFLFNILGRGEPPIPIPAPAPLPGYGTYLMRFQDVVFDRVAITDLDIDPANSRRIIVTAPGLTAGLQGSSYSVRGVTVPPGVNRIWQARAAFPIGGPAILERSRRPLQGAWSGDGTVRAIRYLYAAPDQYLPVGLRNKKTGRIFRQLRGRSVRA